MRDKSEEYVKSMQNLFDLVKEKRTVTVYNGPRMSKKELRELRKEAKANGMKVEGKKDQQGNFHISVVKGSFRRVIR